ncbi:glycoside hydrolase family 5 protein [Apiospora phragmitis]|uniref:glucan endo-1,6-beta-glucosidase n=1 Tax=Apiospora phragmitis TaxID=2905665 RepID=A0ABR1TR12_9PEZI
MLERHKPGLDIIYIIPTSCLVGLFFLAVATAGVRAWLPWERDLEAFNRSTAGLDKRVNLPSKIRGVNLGGWLVSEPWMMTPEWRNMGCITDTEPAACSEFDCVSRLGQSKADTAFDNHYRDWIIPNDVQKIHDAGLNTIRIPWGTGSIGKAADLGMFVIIDLHGAPGAQKLGDAFTGQCLTQQYLPGFFSQYNYDRASRFLTWMTQRIYNTPSYKKAVGVIEVVNEPERGNARSQQEKDTLTQVYYPQALRAVRAVEDSMNVNQADRLHVQFMDGLWDSGNPKSNLPSDSRVMFDDHNYVGDAIPQKDNAKQADYMWYTCKDDDRLTDGDTPKVVGEFSLTVKASIENNSDFDPHQSQNYPFYQQWWGAQQRLYEKTNGWIFWTWKTQLNNPRWDYQLAISSPYNFIPNSASGLDTPAGFDFCKKYFGN